MREDAVLGRDGDEAQVLGRAGNDETLTDSGCDRMTSSAWALGLRNPLEGAGCRKNSYQRLAVPSLALAFIAVYLEASAPMIFVVGSVESMPTWPRARRFDPVSLRQIMAGAPTAPYLKTRASPPPREARGFQVGRSWGAILSCKWHGDFRAR